MTTIIASLALFISMVGLWIASANIKKIMVYNQELKTLILADVDKQNKEILKKVEALEKKNDALGGKIKTITEGQAQVSETVVLMEKEVSRVGQELKSLDDALPPQFKRGRARV